MTVDEKLALLEETMEAENLREGMDLDMIEEYDSLARLSIIVMMKDEFGIDLDAEKLKEFTNINELLKIME